MDTFVTILTVSLPQQLWIIKGRLESEGIQCFVKDELTVQAYNLYSNAVGGVKLQVLEEDVEKARSILTELGYIKEEPVQPDLLTRIDAKTSFIPFLKNVNVVTRIIIITLISIIFLTTFLYLIFKPSLYDKLTSTIWCVDRIDYRNKTIGPNTNDKVITISSRGDTACYENVDFRKNHDIILPGINSNSIWGNWRLNNDKITITVNMLKNVFEGDYEVDESNNSFTLRSKTTVIYFHKDNFVLF